MVRGLGADTGGDGSGGGSFCSGRYLASSGTRAAAVLAPVHSMVSALELLPMKVVLPVQHVSMRACP